MKSVRGEENGETLVDWLPKRGRGRPKGVRGKSKARHDDPEFVPSLRLLVAREQYVLADIGAMFGVTLERVRQWCVKYQIEYPTGTGYGTGSQRVWNDERHCFEPFRGRIMKDVRLAARASANREARERRRKARQVRIVAIVQALKVDLGRDPTLPELAAAITGDPVSASSAGSIVAGRWDSRGRNCRGDNQKAREWYAATMASFEAATGVTIRGVGATGHIIAPRDNPNITEK